MRAMLSMSSRCSSDSENADDDLADTCGDFRRIQVAPVRVVSHAPDGLVEVCQDKLLAGGELTDQPLCPGDDLGLALG